MRWPFLSLWGPLPVFCKKWLQLHVSDVEGGIYVRVPASRELEGVLEGNVAASSSCCTRLDMTLAASRTSRTGCATCSSLSPGGSSGRVNRRGVADSFASNRRTTGLFGVIGRLTS